MRALFDTRAEYLQAAFDAIDRQYGGTENYLVEGLGISAESRRQIEARLLGPAVVP
jgi:protein-tyrosine phosphatase